MRTFRSLPMPWRRPSPRDGSTDAGFSLVEIVVSISLMALGVLALLGASLMSARSSTQGRTSAELVTVLQNAADRVNRADPGCDYKIFVEAAVRSKGWPATTAVATYQHYVPGASAAVADQGTWMPSVPGPAASDACPVDPTTGPTRTPRLVQLVTITITDPEGSVRSIQVVKSDV
jgi:type II secretory pathway pseudopilin PulG